jgi:hypothetical protein
LRASKNKIYTLLEILSILKHNVITEYEWISDYIEIDAYVLGDKEC